MVCSAPVALGVDVVLHGARVEDHGPKTDPAFEGALLILGREVLNLCPRQLTRRCIGQQVLEERRCGWAPLLHMGSAHRTGHLA